jgi:CHAD domain-containing protein
MNAEARAEDVLGPALSALVTDVRAATERVVSTAGAEAEADTEAVHDLRVAIRRLRTLLRVARAVYGRRRLSRIEAELRWLVQTTGALRDAEVLEETLHALSLPPEAQSAVDAWSHERLREAQARRAEVALLLREGPPERVRIPVGARGEAKRVRPLERTLGDLEAVLARGKTRRRLGAAELGRRALGKALGDILVAASAEASDAAAMHELRIRFKRLRYAAELLAPSVGDGAEALARQAARLQKRLGELHDLDEASLRVANAGALAPVRAVTRSALQEARARLAARAVEDLSRVLPQLREALDRITGAEAARPFEPEGSGDPSTPSGGA